MLGTPEQRAWVVLIAGFVVFSTTLVSLPLVLRAYIVNATTVEPTVLEEPIDGVVRVRQAGGQNMIAVTQRVDEIPEGATIATDEHSRAFLRFFDDSTLMLYNDTEIVLPRVRSRRYERSPKQNDIQIRITRGRVGIAVASPLKETAYIGVHTPHAFIMLEEGSYKADVEPVQTQLYVRTIRPGEATVITDDDQLSFSSGRCRIVQGQGIEGRLPPEQNLILNHDFASPLGLGWEVQLQQRDDESDPYGGVEIAFQDGKSLLSFRRRGARTHGETSVIQYIDKDVRDVESLTVSFEVMVEEQSLRGGGYESTEFPVMVELQYKDAQGNARSEYWGFYYLDPGVGQNWRKMVNGNKVVQDEWYFFESDNLMRTLGDNHPVHIDGVRIYASGWSWDSAITNVSLLVRE